MKKFIIRWYKILVSKFRDQLVACTNYFIKKLSEFELFLNRFIVSSNPNGYEDLTPTNNGNEDGKYSVALEWALKNNNIKNIALTGAYGSGKSKPSANRVFQNP